MLVISLLALSLGVAYTALWLLLSARGARRAAVCWLLYAVYEYLMHARVLCTGECNIRVDLLLVWPALLIVSAAGPIAYFRQALRSRHGRGR